MRNHKKLILCAVLLPIAFAYAGTEPQTESGKTNPAAQDWTYEKLKKTFAESGRKMNISEKTFNDIQERKKAALTEIENYLKERLGRADPVVMKAFAEVPREYFHYHYEDKYPFINTAYEEKAKP